MRSKISGHAFEADVIRGLRHVRRCEVFASEALDLKHKVDGEIRVVDGTRLVMPVQYQMTRRIDHYTKLRKYLKTRWLNTDIVSLYVEAEPDCLAATVADDLAWAAVMVQTLPPYGPLPWFGLRVGEDAVFFDPAARLEELRLERESPDRQNAFKRGLAHGIDKEGFIISGEDCSEYRVHFIEIDDGVFRRLLRENIDSPDACFPVSFLPCGKFARDVRFRPIVEGPEEPDKT